jgi:hypothetical protein
MKRSRLVLVTFAANSMITMAIVARGQDPVNPCDSATFNARVCKSAVRFGGYCAPGGWTPVALQQPYKDYVQMHRNFEQIGGVTTPAEAGNCGRFAGSSGTHVVSYGGFGSTGASHSASC